LHQNIDYDPRRFTTFDDFDDRRWTIADLPIRTSYFEVDMPFLASLRLKVQSGQCARMDNVFPIGRSAHEKPLEKGPFYIFF